MKTIIIFLSLFVGVAAMAQDSKQQEGKSLGGPAYASIHDGHRVILSFEGIAAQMIYEGMPKSSVLTKKENCYSGTTMKVQGGFICSYALDPLVDPSKAYSCSLEVSAKTGKVLERKRNDMCGADGV